MARGQLLSLILARQHQKVGDPCHKQITVQKKQKYLYMKIFEKYTGNILIDLLYQRDQL